MKQLAYLEAQEQSLAAKWEGHVTAVMAGEEAVVAAQSTVVDLDAQTKETEARVAQLNTDLEAMEGKVDRFKFTAGMLMTTISMGFRITRQLFKGVSKDFDRAISFLAAMFSHVATLAWQASALAAGTGNVVMATMHAGIAVMSAAHGIQVANQRWVDDRMTEQREEMMSQW